MRQRGRGELVIAIAFVSNRHLTAPASVGLTEALDLATGGAIALGNHLILAMAYDNSGTAGVDPFPQVVDPRGNVWTLLAKAVNDPSATADAGACVAVFLSHTQAAYLNGDDLTVNFSFSTTGAVFRIEEFSGIRPITYPVVGPNQVTGSSANATAGDITPPVTGQLVFAAAAINSNGVMSGDADTTNGAWVIAMNSAATSSLEGLSQYKIVTAAGLQNWTITNTNTAWAATAVVLDVFVPVADTLVKGNPSYPCVAGFEGLPTDTTTVPIDTGTAYRLRHRISPDANGTQDYAINYHFKTPESTVAHSVCADLYISGNETPQDEITTVVLPVRLATGTSTSPAGNVLANVNEPGGTPVTMTDGDTLELAFDPAQLTSMYANYRVLRFGIRYLAWKDDSSPVGIPGGEGFEAAWRDDGANGGFGAGDAYGAWLVPNYQRDVQYETRWFGEVNQYPRGVGTIVVGNLFQRACFTVNDLSHMASGDDTTSVIITSKAGADPLQTNVYMDYFEMVVELAPERRLGHGVRFVSNSYSAGTLYPFNPVAGPNENGSRIFTALNTNTYARIPSANEYVTVIREPLPPSPSDYYRARTSSFQQLSLLEAVGPALQLFAFTQPRETLDPQPEVTQVAISGGVFVGGVSAYDQYYLGLSIYDRSQLLLNGPFVLGFRGLGTPNLLQVHTTQTQAQYIRVDGATTFDRIKVLVRPDDLTTAALSISIELPYLTPIATATISVATALLGEDVGNGWREVSVALSAPITPAASSVVALVFSSSAATALAPWEVAGAAPINNFARWGYNSQNQTAPFSYMDYAAVLQCSLALPDQVITNQAATFADTGPCATSTMTIPRLTFSNGALYDFLAIERSINSGTSWDPVKLLVDPTNGQIFDDVGVPWDIASIRYRATGYRDSDRRAVLSLTDTWSGTAVAPGAAFGLVDYTSSELYAYVPVDESDLEIAWNPMNPVSRVELHGLDYSVALRSPEERGLQVSVVVAVSHFSTCGVAGDDLPSSYLPEIVAPGTRSMTPKPFDSVRGLEQRPRLQLNLPGGHTRAVSLDLGTMSIRTVHGLYLSEITLTDVLLLEMNPYD